MIFVYACRLFVSGFYGPANPIGSYRAPDVGEIMLDLSNTVTLTHLCQGDSSSRSAASDLGLHFWPMPLLWDSRLNGLRVKDTLSVKVSVKVASLLKKGIYFKRK